MNNEMPKFEQKQTLEVEGSTQVIEALDSIIEPIEKIKMMVMEMQKIQAGASDKLNGQFSEENIQWIDRFAEKIKESSAENVRLLKFFVKGNYDGMKEDNDNK